MPVHKARGPRGGQGYQWGEHGKVYRTKAEAARQGRAIEASKARAKAKK